MPPRIMVLLSPNSFTPTDPVTSGVSAFQSPFYNRYIQPDNNFAGRYKNGDIGNRESDCTRDGKDGEVL